MKILLVGPKWIGGWLDGVMRSFQVLGHEVRTFAYTVPNAPSIDQNKLLAKSYVPSALHSLILPVAETIGILWERTMNRRLIEIGASYQADLVLILKGELLQAETLVALKSSSKQIASWWLDDPFLYFPDYPQVIDQLQMIDNLFVFDYSRFDELKKMGVSDVHYLPCGCDLNVYNPGTVSASDENKFRCDVGFIASYYPERGALVDQLQGVNVAIWGGGWKNSVELEKFPPDTFRGKKLTGIDAAKVYNVASICINLHHSQSRAGGLNMRTYEIPAAGGFEITDYIPGIENQFEIGSEMVVYRSMDEFRELVEYYLNYPEERMAIAKRGRERVLRNHTYEQRMKTLLQALK